MFEIITEIIMNVSTDFEELLGDLYQPTISGMMLITLSLLLSGCISAFNTVLSGLFRGRD